MQSASNRIFESLSFLLEPDLAIPLAMFGLVMLFLSWEGKKPKLAFARWAGTAEKLAALNLAMKQLQQRQHDKICLYLGTPKYRIHLNPIPKSASLKEQLNLRWENLSLATHARIQTGLLNSPPTVLLPSAERGIVRCGSPGSGKTFSLDDPLIRSAINEGLTLLVYDVKGDLMRNHAAYAVEAGYEIYVFAPGFPYSGCINLLDFMRDEADATMAREIAHVINQNAKKGNQGKPDEFFGPAADQLVQTILMLAKGSIYPDLLMAFKLLGLPNLAKRLLVASSQFRLDLWAEVSATQIMSVADAERTVSGIVGAAINTFSNLVNRDFIPAIAGQATIPLDLRGKKVIFFQTDEERESVSVPLLATNMHMLIKRNANNRVKGQSRYAVIIDEAPSIYLGDLKTYPNRLRSYGLCTAITYQNEAQMKAMYGDNGAKEIIAAFSTKAIFCPSDGETAQKWSDYLGKTEVNYKQRSRSYGKNSSRSDSEQNQTIPLMSADEINAMYEGEAVVISPAYRGSKWGKRRASVPWHLKQVPIPEDDLAAQERSQALWDEKVRDRLEQKAKKSQLHLDDGQLGAELLQRGEIADWMLPSPKEIEAEKKAESEPVF